MPNSKLKKSAERCLIIAQSLSDPADRAVASKCAEELEYLAACEVSAPALPLGAASEELRVATLGVTLRKAFPIEDRDPFHQLIAAFG